MHTFIHNKICGDYSGEATPVPIPNTEVKLLSADDTWRATSRESRTLPLISFFAFFDILFFRFFSMIYNIPNYQDLDKYRFPGTEETIMKICRLMMCFTIAIAMTVTMIPWPGGAANIVYAETATANGGSVLSNSVENVKAAFGSENVIVEHNDQNIAITLQKDISLLAPVLFQRDPPCCEYQNRTETHIGA